MSQSDAFIASVTAVNLMDARRYRLVLCNSTCSFTAVRKRNSMLEDEDKVETGRCSVVMIFSISR